MSFVIVLPVTGNLIKNNTQNISRIDIDWEKTYGSDLIDWGNCIQQTSDGGYIISGTYNRNAWSLWYSHFYLIKIDSEGNEEWNKIYGLLNSEHVAKNIQQTTDGGYIIAGYQGVTYQYDAVVQKTDSTGNILWENTYGDANAYDTAQYVSQTSDGGYIVTGMTNSYGSLSSDILLLKIDSTGNQEWIKTLGGSDQDAGYCVRQTSDGGFIIVGETDSYGDNGDVFLVKTDNLGNEEWNQTFGGNEWDCGHSVQQTTDDGYILCGWYKNDMYDSDVYLIKTDDLGNEEWNKKFGDVEYDEGQCVMQTSDGGYFITGIYTDTVNLDTDVYLIKTDSSGIEEWSEIFDNGDTEDVGYFGIETSDGGFIATGYTGFYMEETLDVWVIKLKESGSNQAPNAPSINGEVNGEFGTEYNYTFSATDPDGDDLYYYIEWGDDNVEDWIGPYESDEELVLGHTWNEKGNYIIKAKVKDTFDVESNYTTLEISMPVNKPIIGDRFPIIQTILELFPNAFPILRYLFGL